MVRFQLDHRHYLTLDEVMNLCLPIRGKDDSSDTFVLERVRFCVQKWLHQHAPDFKIQFELIEDPRDCQYVLRVVAIYFEDPRAATLFKLTWL